MTEGPEEQSFLGIGGIIIGAVVVIILIIIISGKLTFNDIFRIFQGIVTMIFTMFMAEISFLLR